MTAASTPPSTPASVLAPGHSSMTKAVPVDALFKALADPTRLRIARLLATMELAVGELAQVLGQSQPRVSRHVGILCDVGLAERRREGSWVFLRGAGANGASANGASANGASASGSGSDEASPIVIALNRALAIAEEQDAAFAAECDDDRRKLAAIRSSRDEAATQYFARHASDWDELRALHSSDGDVEAGLIDALEGHELGALLDIGTGTGRMAELFAGNAARVVALDKNLEMLRVARAKLQHLPTAQVELVQGDFADLPFAPASFDTVLLHQVLHFAADPAAALVEAARVTRPQGRIAIVDFAAHDREELRSRYQHARLGFSDSQMATLLRQSGFTAREPAALDSGELVVKIWIGQRKPALDDQPTPMSSDTLFQTPSSTQTSKTPS